MDKALQREQTRQRVERYRNKQKALHSDSVTPKALQYRPIIIALSDPIKREKLRKICASLEAHNVLDTANYYGCGIDPTPMSEVAELLTAFE